MKIIDLWKARYLKAVDRMVLETFILGIHKDLMVWGDHHHLLGMMSDFHHHLMVWTMHYTKSAMQDPRFSSKIQTTSVFPDLHWENLSRILEMDHRHLDQDLKIVHHFNQSENLLWDPSRLRDHPQGIHMKDYPLFILTRGHPRVIHMKGHHWDILIIGHHQDIHT